MIAGKTFGLLGSLKSYPRRALAREVNRQGGELQHRVTRRTSHVVFGRSLLERLGETRVKEVFAAHKRDERAFLSEDGFLRALGLTAFPANSGLARHALIDQSKLDGETLDLLAAFDAFEHDNEPFSFRDLILARKYAELIANGTSWLAVARSVRGSEHVSSLTALTLKPARGAVVARHGEGLMDLSGQALFDFSDADNDLEDTFALAEDAEESGRFKDAADLYARCVAIDKSDPVAFFNRANCLAEAGDPKAAELAYFRALKLDPRFAEAWFNLSRLASAEGKVDVARRYLSSAVELDHTYADAVYNLARLEFDAGNLVAAKRLWTRYLQLDNDSEWAKRAAKGIQYIDLLGVRDGRPVSL